MVRSRGLNGLHAELGKGREQMRNPPNDDADELALASLEMVQNVRRLGKPFLTYLFEMACEGLLHELPAPSKGGRSTPYVKRFGRARYNQVRLTARVSGRGRDAC